MVGLTDSCILLVLGQLVWMFVLFCCGLLLWVHLFVFARGGVCTYLLTGGLLIVYCLWGWVWFGWLLLRVGCLCWFRFVDCLMLVLRFWFVVAWLFTCLMFLCVLTW